MILILSSTNSLIKRQVLFLAQILRRFLVKYNKRTNMGRITKMNKGLVLSVLLITVFKCHFHQQSIIIFLLGIQCYIGWWHSMPTAIDCY
jgi:hypothetical protein